MVDIEILRICAYATPLFLLSLCLGQKYHNRIPEKPFNLGIDILLGVSCVFLIKKWLLPF